MTRRTHLRVVAVPLLILLAASGPLSAATLYVHTTGDDSRSCRQPSNPCLTLCKAIGEAKQSAEADEIWVAEGTYTGGSDCNPCLNLMVPDPLDPRDPASGCALVVPSGDPGISLLGGWDVGFSNRLPALRPTVVDGAFTGRLLVIGTPGTAASNVVVDGFIFENGSSPFPATDPLGVEGAGGGILILHSSALLTNNIIRQNITQGPRSHGGGVAVWTFDEASPDHPGVPAEFLDVQIDTNEIAYNQAIGYGGGVAVFDPLIDDPGGSGRMIMNPDASAPVLRANNIHDNESRDDFETAAFGGGVWIGQNRAVLDGNIIEANLAYGERVQVNGFLCWSSRGVNSGNGGGIGLRRAAPTITNNQIQGNTAKIKPDNSMPCFFVGQGGGAYFNTFYGTMSDNVIADNTAEGGNGFAGIQGQKQAMGGGLSLQFAGSLPSLAPVSVSRNLIVGNSTTGGGQISASGGGVYLYDFGGTFSRNTITTNTSAYRGGGLAVYQYGGDPEIPAAGQILDNHLEGNTAQTRGGGLFLHVNTLNPSIPTTTVRHLRVRGNQLVDVGGEGAGMQLVGDPIVTNVDVSGNQGDGLFMTDFIPAIGVNFPTNPSVENATIDSNSGTGLLQRGLSPGATLANSILRNNSVQALDQSSGGPLSANLEVLFSNLEGIAPPDQGNFDADPLFVTGAEGGFYLSQPLADAVQTVQSLSVDAGTGTPAAFGLDPPWTTRTDGGEDWCVVDQGYHYRVRVDSDGDTLLDDEDNCPAVDNPGQEDTDGGDGIGDACDGGADTDGDTEPDNLDNCPRISNTGQADLDGDTIGDVCDPDVDGDGAPDADELSLGLNALSIDSDGDTIPDGRGPCECRIDDQDGDLAINALDCDSDADGIPDTIEAGLDGPGGGLCPSATDADGGFTLTSPCNVDSDGGGEQDGLEDTNKDGAVDPGERDPTNGMDDDADDDGLTNLEEINRPLAPTDPYDADTDDDGVSDGDEDLFWATDPLDCDSDDDGIHDGTELGVTSPVCHPERDLNGNGCEDEGTDLTATCFNVVTSLQTLAYRPDADPASTTDPTVTDSDGDGCSDGVEDANQNGNNEGPPAESPADVFNIPSELSQDCATPQPPEFGPGGVRRLTTGVVEFVFEPSFNADWYRLFRGTLANLATGDYNHQVGDAVGSCEIPNGPGPLTAVDLDPNGSRYVDGTASYYYLLAAEHFVAGTGESILSNFGYARLVSGFRQKRPCNQDRCTCTGHSTIDCPTPTPQGECP